MGARQTVEFTGGVSRSTAMHKRKRLSRNQDLVPVGSPLRTSRDLPGTRYHACVFSAGARIGIILV